MKMQKEIVEKGKLLDEKGHLIECGYAKSLIKDYDRKDIKACKLRIKEWDYYLIYNDEYAVALTIDDNSYMGLNSISFIDFKNAWEKTVSPMSFMPKGKTNLPSSSTSGSVSVANKNYNISFEKFDDKRILKASMKSFLNGKDINLEFELSAEPKDSMVIITPFKEKKTAFYYNQKIVGFKAKGTVSIGDDRYIFNESNTRAILDWGRGVWTYKNTWYWGAGCGVVDGHEFGFNIGYGFGDTSSASENMLFYDGVAHKLDKVTFNIPKNAKGKDDYLSQWTFTSNDGRFEMTFDPIIDRHANANALIISSNQHQVFGRFNGTATLDNGEKIVLKDFVAFAETLKNKW